MVFVTERPSTDRVPTGIKGLDQLIGGGFPRGSLVVLGGNPGTGKTVFASQFWCAGARTYKEPGVYASFAESRETLIHNISKHLGIRCGECEAKDLCRILDLATTREEGVSETLNLILKTMGQIGAKRLVIDSFSALVQGFEEPKDVRIVLHTALYKITRQLGTTTIMIVEIPTARGEVGLGVEEFVADGILVLSRQRLEERDLRELEVAKLRGTEVSQSSYVFTLHGGFYVFPPYEAKQVKVPKSFQPTQDSATHFSTGIQYLDKVLGGGYRRGSVVLIEVGQHVPGEAYRLLSRPITFQFLAQGRPVTIFVTSGVNPEAVRREYASVVGEDVVNRLVRFYVRRLPGIERTDPWYIEYEGKSLEDDYSARLRVRRKLEEDTRQPALNILGADHYEATYGTEIAPVVSRTVAEDTFRGNLDIVVCKPGVRNTQLFRDISTYHFVIRVVNGAMVLYLAKPHTGAFCLEDDISKGYREPRLTPID